MYIVEPTDSSLRFVYQVEDASHLYTHGILPKLITRQITTQVLSFEDYQARLDVIDFRYVEIQTLKAKRNRCRYDANGC